jgi:vacuolar-type H+-ATPase subunit H
MTALDAALAPVRAALLGAARAEAQRVRADAEERAATVLADARNRAARMLADATRQGAADADSLLAGERARARRQARAVVLRAGRDAYEALRAQARDAAARLGDDPVVRGRLVATARDGLGPGARVSDVDGGGVVAEVSGRRLDLSLAGFAARAVDAVLTGEST